MILKFFWNAANWPFALKIIINVCFQKQKKSMARQNISWQPKQTVTRRDECAKSGAPHAARKSRACAVGVPGSGSATPQPRWARLVVRPWPKRLPTHALLAFGVCHVAYTYFVRTCIQTWCTKSTRTLPALGGQRTPLIPSLVCVRDSNNGDPSRQDFYSPSYG